MSRNFLLFAMLQGCQAIRNGHTTQCLSYVLKTPVTCRPRALVRQLYPTAMTLCFHIGPKLLQFILTGGRIHPTVWFNVATTYHHGWAVVCFSLVKMTNAPPCQNVFVATQPFPIVSGSCHTAFNPGRSVSYPCCFILPSQSSGGLWIMKSCE